MNKSKSTLVLKPTKTLKPPSGVAAMLLDSGLDENASFEVQSQDPDPSLITPSKSTYSNGLPMEVYDEKRVSIVDAISDLDPMEDMLSIDSGNAEDSTGNEGGGELSIMLGGIVTASRGKSDDNANDSSKSSPVPATGC